MFANFFFEKGMAIKCKKSCLGFTTNAFYFTCFSIWKDIYIKHTNIEYTKTTLYSNMKSD